MRYFDAVSFPKTRDNLPDSRGRTPVKGTAHGGAIAHADAAAGPDAGHGRRARETRDPCRGEADSYLAPQHGRFAPDAVYCQFSRGRNQE